MTGPDQGIALEASGVVKRYGTAAALDGVSLSVSVGETVALVGESGSGKTTLLRCFNGMVAPESGEVRAGGRPVRDTDVIELRRSLGYVPQEGGLLPHWDVERNVALVPWLREWPDARDRARSALELVGLPAATFGGRWPSQLSGGQRQRVAIARALAARPSIILLDEPFGALDAITRAELQDVFLELRDELSMAVLLVTHDLHEAVRLADRVAVLRDGRLEQIDAPARLVQEPATPYVRALLARAHVDTA